MLKIDTTLKQVSLEARQLSTCVSTEGFTDKVRSLLQNFKAALTGQIAFNSEVIKGNVLADLVVAVKNKPYHELMDIQVNCTRGLNSELKVWLGALESSYNAAEPIVNHEMDRLINVVGQFINDPSKLSANLVPKVKGVDVRKSENDLFKHLKSHRKDQIPFSTLFKSVDQVTDTSLSYKELLEVRSKLSMEIVKGKVDKLTALLDQLSFWLDDTKASVSPAVAKQLGTTVQHVADYISFYALVEQELLIVQSSIEKLTTDVKKLK